MTILIVDDQASNRIILKFFLESEGYKCVEAENGKEAIEKFKETEPDCVLMDIVMPVMDGYESAKQIKALTPGYHIPIIFLTAKTDEESILKCLEMGGDDYLPKPVNQVMLMAKIRAHGRTKELTQEIQSKNKELTLLHATLTQEYEMGQHVLNHTLARSWHDCPNIRSYLSSMSMFNGDLCLVSRKPGGGLYVMLGDFTGHGLAAAIGVIPVSQVFYAMSVKGMAIMDIAASMNATLKSFLPEYMFCAAIIMDMDEAGETLKVWAGGLPNSPIIRPGKGVVRYLESKHMPLGILDQSEFDDEIEIVKVQAGDKVLMLTDGILEGMNDADVMFGEKRLEASIGHGNEGYFDNVLKEYEAFVGQEDQQDDCSLVELTANPLRHNAKNEDTETQAWIPWSSKIRLDTELLKLINDPVSQMVQLFPRASKFSAYLDSMRTAFAELYSNALEHGLLNLESSMKADAEGFMEYYTLREERLMALQEGYIDVELDYDPKRTGEELKLVVEDSGEGYQKQNVSLEENTNEWGRGIPLIESLCQKVNYLRNGARVELFFSVR